MWRQTTRREAVFPGTSPCAHTHTPGHGLLEKSLHSDCRGCEEEIVAADNALGVRARDQGAKSRRTSRQALPRFISFILLCLFIYRAFPCLLRSGPALSAGKGRKIHDLCLDLFPHHGRVDTCSRRDACVPPSE